MKTGAGFLKMSASHSARRRAKATLCILSFSITAGEYPPSQSEPQPGGSRDTGRPPGGGGGGGGGGSSGFEAEGPYNLETLTGLKGLDPNAGRGM